MALADEQLPLSQEGEFRAVLRWVEEHALKPVEDSSQEVMSMLPEVGMPSKEELDDEIDAEPRQKLDPWAQRLETKRATGFGRGVGPIRIGGKLVDDWEDPVLAWHGEAMLMVFQANFQGKQQRDLLKNLERVQPIAAQGIEVWFKLLREFRGASGPRLIKLANSILHPARAKMKDVRGALESWESDGFDFEFSGQRLGSVLRLCGIFHLFLESWGISQSSSISCRRM